MDTFIAMTGKADRRDTSTPSNRHSVYEFLMVLLLAGLMAWLMSYLLNPSTLPIRHVRIEGEFRHLSPDILRKRIDSQVKGGFFNIDVTAVRDRLLSEPWVHDVSVHRVWPDSLQVFVTEQVAVAIWKDTGLLNKRGEYFTPEKTTFPDSLPVILGPEGQYRHMMEKYYFLQSLLSPYSMQIMELTLDERRAWTLKLDSGLKILLGRKDFESRIQRFTALVPQFFGDKVNHAESIDMRYPNGFAVKWKAGFTATHNAGGAL